MPTSPLPSNFEKSPSWAWKILLLLNSLLFLWFGLSSPMLWSPCSSSPQRWQPQCAPALQPTLALTLFRKMEVHMGLAPAPATRNLKPSKCTTAALYLHWKWAESEEVISEVKIHINLNSFSLKTEEGPLRISDLGVLGDFHHPFQPGIREPRRGTLTLAEAASILPKTTDIKLHFRTELISHAPNISCIYLLGTADFS